MTELKDKVFHTRNKNSLVALLPLHYFVQFAFDLIVQPHLLLESLGVEWRRLALCLILSLCLPLLVSLRLFLVLLILLFVFIFLVVFSSLELDVDIAHLIGKDEVVILALDPWRFWPIFDLADL